MAKKRAIALSGGGPVAGIEIGALKAFEEKNIDFDIYSCACVGSWVGCFYNSLLPEEDRIAALDRFFREQIFLEDDVYESFPINYKVFQMNYLRDYGKLMEKILDFNTYRYLFLPHRMAEYGWNFLSNPPREMSDLYYCISEGLALNPFMRFMAQLQYKIEKSGIAGLISSQGFVDKFIDFDQLFKCDKIVYINAYDLSRKKMEIFINQLEHPYNDIDADALMAGSSVLHYTENRTVDGKENRYCEGAVIDTVNLDVLLNDHKDLDEIWVIKIADYKEAAPPKDLVESALVGVMLPFNTISEDDIRLFSYRLEEHNRKSKKKIRMINIEMSYGDLNYHWNHANLDQGIKVGYEGTLKQIDAYNNGR
ncbi:MAG: patatin-like phospholipase family protein [Desulfobacteraceae bacterium]|nr:patatin-like phospholipase family protein [Desulfobacteraceae bacterium]